MPDFLKTFKVLMVSKQRFLQKKVNRQRRENVARSMAGQLDMSMDSMEETRFRKRNQYLIHRLEKRLHFNYLELECLLIMYYKLQKEGQASNPKQEGVTKIQFRDVLHCALDMTDDSLMDRVFLAIDKGPSACISMETWATALSLFLRGTLDEQIQFCFSVYDIMGDGILARDTIFQLLRTSMISQSGEEDAEESARDMIEVITKKMDIDRDGKISFQDYRQSVTKNPMLLEAFGQCLPSRIAAYSFLCTFAEIADTL
ncbi:EF-hand calcium-binding domain-containing protein 1-like [Sitophilus oryzae]|uniref:EF-hand calcium-binding domain-containing protein 1-like n=1 Tax=Sitophilus oryzae TaxID=7048 RepID=A0A6J2YAU5_SITOR|nr:EF-hand calcium-binding domain-containing protein 1-like [Sitophilus oryzae]